jgi:hypothetical protein
MHNNRFTIKPKRGVSFIDKKLSMIKLNRERLVAEEEANILKRIEDRALRRKTKLFTEHLQALQSSWIVIISQVYVCLYFTYIFNNNNKK